MRITLFLIFFLVSIFVHAAPADAQNKIVLLSPLGTDSVSHIHKKTTSTDNNLPLSTDSASVSPDTKQLNTFSTTLGIKTSRSANFYTSTKLSPETTKVLSSIAFAVFVLGMLFLRGNLLWMLVKKIFYQRKNLRFTQTLLLQI